jgi:hypothetical protein
MRGSFLRGKIAVSITDGLESRFHIFIPAKAGIQDLNDVQTIMVLLVTHETGDYHHGINAWDWIFNGR